MPSLPFLVSFHSMKNRENAGPLGPPDFVAIGNVTEDVIAGGRKIPGGSVLYSTMTAARLDRSIGVVTAYADGFPGKALLEGFAVKRVKSAVTTTFHNTYCGGSRLQKIGAVAGRITASEVPEAWLRSPVVNVCPVFGETDLEGAVFSGNTLVGVGLQGFLRKREDGDRVVRRSVDELPGWLSAQVFSVSREDLGGDEDALSALLPRCDILLYTLGSKGADVFHRGRRTRVPAFRTNEIEPTGAGDVFTAAFLVRYAENPDLLDAARFAACAGSICVEREGLAGVPEHGEIAERFRLYAGGSHFPAE